MVPERSWDVCSKLPEESALLQAVCWRCPACRGTALRPRSLSSGEWAPRSTAEIQQQINSQHSTQIIEGKAVKALLSPQGTAEKPHPGLLTTKESHRCCQWPPCPEPVRLMCFMPFSKSTVHWYAVKWFTPLQWGGVIPKPCMPLGVLEGEVSRQCCCFPLQQPCWQAVQLSHNKQAKEYFSFKQLSEQCLWNNSVHRQWSVKGQNDSCDPISRINPRRLAHSWAANMKSSAKRVRIKCKYLEG